MNRDFTISTEQFQGGYCSPQTALGKSISTVSYPQPALEPGVATPQIAEQHQKLKNALDSLEKGLEMLRMRLGPILSMDVQPIDPTCKGEVCEAVAPLADAMRTEVQRVQRLSNSLTSILQRIEV